jgi:hypothetical protein
VASKIFRKLKKKTGHPLPNSDLLTLSLKRHVINAHGFFALFAIHCQGNKRATVSEE